MRLISTAQAGRTLARRCAPVVLGTALVALAGCGSSSKSTTSNSTPAAATPAESATTPTTPAAGGSTLSLSANPEGNLKYSTTSLSAKSGTVTLNFTNAAPLPHNVNIENAAHSIVGKTETFSGGTKTLRVSLKAGTYKFFCSVPGHRMAGMEGTLTIT